MDDAQAHFRQAMIHVIEDRRAEAIEEFDNALRAGLPEGDEVACRAHLGVTCLQLAVDTGEWQAGDGPLFDRGIGEIQGALRLDHSGSYGFFADKTQRDAIFWTLDKAYAATSRMLAATRGLEDAIGYLEGTLTRFYHIPGTHLLFTHLQLGYHHREAGNEQAALKHFNLALEAEPPSGAEEYDVYLDGVAMTRAAIEAGT